MMRADELFPVSRYRDASPRDRWLRHHRVVVNQAPIYMVGFKDDHGRRVQRYQAWCEYPATDDPEKFYGTTADEALAALAKAKGWRLWKQA